MGMEIDLPKYKNGENYSRDTALPLLKDVEDDIFYYYCLRTGKIKRSYSTNNLYYYNNSNNNNTNNNISNDNNNNNINNKSLNHNNNINNNTKSLKELNNMTSNCINSSLD